MEGYTVFKYGKTIISQIWSGDITLNLEGEPDGWTFLPVPNYFAS